MRLRVAGLCLLAVSGVLGGVCSASAQPSTVSANYDLFYRELGDTSGVGVHMDVAKPLGVIAVVGEVGFNHFKGATVASFAGGARYLIPHSRSSKIEPAVQVLVGRWHCGVCDVDENFIQPGFLVDLPTIPTLKIRVQFDLRRIFFEDFLDETAKRFSVGAVWSF